jgi:hypothetical protein
VSGARRRGRQGARRDGGSVGLTAVDPWLRTHLRLAERQGLYRGKHISAPQALGLIILNHLDLIEKEEANTLALKRSLLANENFDYKKLFPDYFPDAPSETVDIDKGDAIPEGVDIDYTGVEWKGGSAYDEYLELMSALNSSSSGEFGGNELVSAEPTWTEWV